MYELLRRNEELEGLPESSDHEVGLADVFSETWCIIIRPAPRASGENACARGARGYMVHCEGQEAYVSYFLFF